MQRKKKQDIKREERLLSSWKGIAAYLDCDVRTCHRWEEKYGLPVYRVDEKSGARVYAFKDELDDWLKRRSYKLSARRRIVRRVLVWGLPLLGTLILAFHLVFVIRICPLEPEDFRIEKDTLVVLDHSGRTLWTYPTGRENLMGEDVYREHFQVKRLSGLPEVLLPFLIIRDIDADGHREVLFVVCTADGFRAGELFCFDRKGCRLWTFDAGRELQFGSNTYSSDYRINGLETEDLDGDGSREIVVLSHHHNDFPSRISVLDARGKVLGDYWNSGRFNDIACEDLDGDGRKEIICGAMNNEYRKASLIVFDPRFVQGASPQSGRFRSPSLPPGREKYHVLLPRTEADQLYNLYDRAVSVHILENQRISVQTWGAGIYFEFGYDLKLRDIRLSHSLERLQRKARREGFPFKALNEDNKEGLADGLLYYDGERWVPEPMPNRKGPPLT